MDRRRGSSIPFGYRSRLLFLFAHTNPVFVIADGEPIRSQEDAAFFVRWIERTLEDLHSMDRWDDPAHKAEVIATFEEGLRRYRAQAVQSANPFGAERHDPGR